MLPALCSGCNCWLTNLVQLLSIYVTNSTYSTFHFFDILSVWSMINSAEDFNELPIIELERLNKTYFEEEFPNLSVVPLIIFGYWSVFNCTKGFGRPSRFRLKSLCEGHCRHSRTPERSYREWNMLPTNLIKLHCINHMPHSVSLQLQLIYLLNTNLIQKVSTSGIAYWLRITVLMHLRLNLTQSCLEHQIQHF